MKLLKICLKGEDENYIAELKKLLYQNFELLSDLGIGFHILLQKNVEKLYIHCQFWTYEGYTIEKIEKIIKATSRSLAEFIIEYKEKQVCEEILELEQRIREIPQRQQLLRYIHLSLHEEDERQRKESQVNWIAERIEKCFWVENQLSLEGFIRFRLKEYWDYWRNCIEFAREEFVIEKELSDYAEGLKSLAFKHEAKVDLLHIVHLDDRNLFLFDQDWRQLYSYLVNGISMVLEGKKARYEDLIMGAIVTLAPTSLIIHSNQENHHIIYTIKRTFKEKVKVCSECKDCKKQKTAR